MSVTPLNNPSSDGRKKRRFLSPEKKFQIFLEAQSGQTPVGEILRREGIYSTDLARIRQQVKEGAVQRLSVRPGPKRKTVARQDYEVLKLDLQDGDSEKKNEWGFVGQIRGQWLDEQQKSEILIMIERAKEKRFSVTRTCIFWRINRRRVVRWLRKRKKGQSMANLKPGPTEPIHRLLLQERKAVLQMAKKEEHADLAHRILAVTAWDLGLFFVSFSSVYRILRSADLMTMRGRPINPSSSQRTHWAESEMVLGHQLPANL